MDRRTALKALAVVTVAPADAQTEEPKIEAWEQVRLKPTPATRIISRIPVDAAEDSDHLVMGPTGPGTPQGVQRVQHWDNRVDPLAKRFHEATRAIREQAALQNFEILYDEKVHFELLTENGYEEWLGSHKDGLQVESDAAFDGTRADIPNLVIHKRLALELKKAMHLNDFIEWSREMRKSLAYMDIWVNVR